MVATVVPAHGADKEVSGGPPLPHRDYPMWVSKKNVSRPSRAFSLPFILSI